eukprot:CAMPEP_0118924782 /NCGR_PEP_ID=MMETSP1169-20130426/2758_1 /TAXON_ID=36882 /ORGANISM="Pyramimonas obovata, Strain CCMP722" /LENGTH=127 /DNA_ID=CAMNT_0006865915 /DNA_START=62 /DNA_END=448 /DNA_ORIENTATION=-
MSASRESGKTRPYNTVEVLDPPCFPSLVTNTAQRLLSASPLPGLPRERGLLAHVGISGRVASVDRVVRRDRVATASRTKCATIDRVPVGPMPLRGARASCCVAAVNGVGGRGGSARAWTLQDAALGA